MRKEELGIMIQAPAIKGVYGAKNIIDEANKRAYEFLKGLSEVENGFDYFKLSGFDKVGIKFEIESEENQRKYSPDDFIILSKEITLEYRLKNVYKFDFNKYDEEVFFDKCNIE